MTEDAGAASEKQSNNIQKPPALKSGPGQWFKTPQTIKQLFDRVPLVTYPSNELPQRTPRSPNKHVLYIFTTEEGARHGATSFNPGCLKWQAYIKFRHIPFTTVASNNHASPSGALPFLIPASGSSSTSAKSIALPSNRIQRWTRDTSGQEKENSGVTERNEQRDPASPSRRKGSGALDAAADMRYEAYMALLDHRIRNAYLCSLYLIAPNFHSIVQPLYIDSSTSNTFVRLTLAYQLRAAARSELLKQSAIIDIEAIHRESDKAFRALSELLGDDEYFFGEAKPGLFDASVFAYTNVLLDESLAWTDKRMHEGLELCQNLVAHRRRIVEAYF